MELNELHSAEKLTEKPARRLLTLDDIGFAVYEDYLLGRSAEAPEI